MDESVTVNGEADRRKWVAGTTDAHLRGLPLIEPRRRKVRVSRPWKVGQRPPVGKVTVSDPFSEHAWKE